eukprot:TRINITY_DN13645_c0_g1_i1.p1 TRINITY_DN13645_c0_g1~~TRINITY_DN13645_c0_g1_i1.p1  ORF type:complete len:1080 (+),score=242.14 TRINITY_DN13645_c0_g1_i1:58-3297(+)
MATRVGYLAFLALGLCRCFASEVGTWQTGSWSECSVPCGNGTMTRSVICSNAGGCSKSEQPDTSAPCRGRSCPWSLAKASSWEPCSNGCGSGVQKGHPACDCPQPCIFFDAECAKTPVPPEDTWPTRDCTNASVNAPSFCVECAARTDASNPTCLGCLPGFTLSGDGRSCQVASRLVSRSFSFSTSGPFVKRAVESGRFTAAFRNALADIAKMPSAGVVLAAAKPTVDEPETFLAIRRLSEENKVCKKALIESKAYIDPSSPGYARFSIDGKPVPVKTSRGLNVVVMNEDTLDVISSQAYDIWEGMDPTQAAIAAKANHQFALAVDALPAGRLVLIALMDAGLENVSPAATAALNSLGADRHVGTRSEFRKAFALAGIKGSRAIAEKEGDVEGSKVSLSFDLPCLEEESIVATAVGTPANDTDAAAAALSKQFDSLNASSLGDHMAVEFKKDGLMLPSNGLKAVSTGGSSPLCPDGESWDGQKCGEPYHPPGVAGKMPAWAWALIGAVALCAFCCAVAFLRPRLCKRGRQEAPVVCHPVAVAPSPRINRVSEAAKASGRTAADAARAAGKSPADVCKEAAMATKAASGTPQDVVFVVATTSADDAIAAHRTPAEAAKVAADAAKATGLSPSDTAVAAGKTAAKVQSAAGGDPNEVTKAAADSAKAAGGSMSDAAKAAGDAATTAALSANKAPSEVAFSAASAAKYAGGSPEDVIDAASASACEVAVAKRMSPEEAGKLASNAAKSCGVPIEDASKAAGEAAGEVAKAAGQTPSDAGKAAAHAVKVAGGSASDAAKAAGASTANAALFENKAPSEVASLAAEAAKKAGGSPYSVSHAIGHASAKAATEAWKSPEEAGKVAADVARSHGAAPIDIAKASGAAAAKVAQAAREPHEEIAKHAADAAKASGGSVADAAKAAADATKAAKGNPDQQAAAAAQAAKAAGGTAADVERATKIAALEPALRVEIRGASGLSSLNHIRDSPFCKCELVPTEKAAQGEYCQTKSISNTLAPEWMETFDFFHWTPGDALKFSVYDQGVIIARSEGSATILSSTFCPNGFAGDLSLRHDEAKVNVRITLPN